MPFLMPRRPSTPRTLVRVGDVSLTKETAAQHALASAIEEGRFAGGHVSRSVVRARSMSEANRLQEALQLMQECKFATLVPMLPLLLSLRGDPYHLGDHFVFEPMFSPLMPQRQIWKTGRQVSKSTAISAMGVLISSAIPYFNTLYVTPLFEMIRRLSSNYVRPFIEQSPVKNLFIDETCNNSVLQRTFKNQSTMFFSFAFLNADRTRGINGDLVSIDECQDIDREFIPIIQQTTSASKYDMLWLSGTPKTLDAPTETYWIQSSQAEWHIICPSCRYENIPSLKYDLDKMIGPRVVKRDVSETEPGVICAKCSRPLSPRGGRWIHHQPHLRNDFPGRHIPQILLPLHYADPVKWATLLGKRENSSENVFYNEVCGESYDVGARLVTQTELQRACMKRPNTLEYMEAHKGDYIYRVVSVDWGGGGEKEQSFTVVTAMGITPSGRVDVVFAHKFRITHNYFAEVAGILDVMKRWDTMRLCHDFGGAGTIREYLMVRHGVPTQMIVPIAYVRASSGATIMRHKPPNNDTGMRAYHQVDKARSLVLTCELIRRGGINFFEYDFRGPDRPGLIHDFLALTEHRVISRFGIDVYTVVRDERAGPDDFANAVNIGACCLFYMAGNWPDVQALAKASLTGITEEELSPENVNWNQL